MADEEDCVLSYAKGHVGDFPIVDRPNFAYVDKWASVYPDKEAFVFRASETEREVISYKNLRTSTENLAGWFRREHQVKRGDRVAILSLNRLAYVLTELALARLGAVSVRVYATMDSRQELTRSLSFTQCRLFLCQKASLSSVSAILDLESHDTSHRLMSVDLPDLEQVICLTGEESPGTVPLPDWRQITLTQQERDQLYQIQSSITLEDDSSIFLTSGSTGMPKFVVHSYAGVLSFPPAVLHTLGISSDDRYFVDRPLAHLGGNSMSVIVFGATMVNANPWITLAQNPCHYLVTIMTEERVTCGLSFPYILYDIVKNGASEAFKRVQAKFFLFGGQLVNGEVIARVIDKLRCPLSNTYGSTEIGGIVCTHITDPLSVVTKYAGQVLPGVEVKIVDKETKQVVRRGEVGSIGIRKAHKWYYLNNEDKMRECHDEEGFFYPGDMARMADDGYIQVLGRDDDMMSVGTVKIYPASIEQKICQHPSVDKAIVFGVPDERLFEVIGAAVQPKPGVTITSQEIIQFFHESVHEEDLMTGSEYGPKFVWIEKSFPMTSSGKVDAKKIKSQCLLKLGIETCKK